MKMKSLLLSSAILFSLFSCSNSDDVVIEQEIEGPALPKVITTLGYTDTDDYYAVEIFTYDTFNRPTEVVHDVRFRGDESRSQITTKKIEYLTDGSILRTRIIENNSGTLITTIRKYMPDTEKQSVKVMDDDEPIGTIEVNNGLAVKYNGIDYTELYEYSQSNDVSQQTFLSLREGDYSQVRRFEYDNHPGVYKYMNIPQWFFVVEIFKPNCRMGRINNIKNIYFGERKSDESTYEYNKAGYPIQIESRSAEGLDGGSAYDYTIKYIKAEILTND